MPKNKYQLTDFQVLLISQIPGMGRKTISKVMEKIPFTPNSHSELLEILIQLQDEIPRLKAPDTSVFNKACEKADQVFSEAKKNNISVICKSNPLFPNKLSSIDDPPVLLFFKGNLNSANLKTCVAVIGTREPSDYGMRWAKRVGAYLATNEYGVISGLALGCDTAGHQGCLEKDGYALAVLANGLDKIYPAANRNLGNRIIESGGCLISEYPPGMRPRKSFFVDRDRIQSGLSAGVIISETGKIGGTMHTANFALMQKRKLACLKHPDKYEGTTKSLGNAFLINGKKAFAIETEEDLRNFLSSLLNIDPEGNQSNVLQNTPADEIKGKEGLTNTKPHEQMKIFED